MVDDDGQVGPNGEPTSSDQEDAPPLELDATLTYSDVGTDSDSKAAQQNSRELQRGAVVGRYVVLDKVGEGGMGAVYAAYDPGLDRKVALKFLHSALTGKEEAKSEEARLLREAQSMARLSHPNVVAVYDVRDHRAIVYIAMEFINGQTLRDWLNETPRTWAEMWPVLEGAGRGLGAAHGAGVVHRDFKPDNVLVDTDGRPRVTDFGLARPAGVSAVPDAMSISAGPLHKTLTVAGSIMGTPRYMAPEQHLAKPASDRSDQFAFALVVFEAIYGERAFAGDTYKELAEAVTNGRLVKPKKLTSVPAWRHQALERALSVDPAQRFSSMEELLTALSENPRARRNRILAGVGVLALVAAAIVLLVSRVKPAAAAPMCTAAASARAFEPAWNPAARQRIHDAFMATKSPLADDTAKRVGDALDGYAAKWVEMHEEACTATHIRGEQSSDMLDLRMECLDQRRVALTALVDVLSDKPTGTTVLKATRAAQALPSLDGCADRNALREVVRPPSDPKLRERVKAIATRNAQLTALLAAGKYKEARTLAPSLVKDARATGYARLVAQVLNNKARWQWAVGKSTGSDTPIYREALRFAVAARDDSLVARLWLDLVPTVKPSEAVKLVEVAELAISRAGSPAKMRASLHKLQCHIFGMLNKVDDAITSCKRSLELYSKIQPEPKASLGHLHWTLARALVMRGEMDKAEAHHKEGIRFTEAALGRKHPNLANIFGDLARMYTFKGRFDEAIKLFHRTIEIQERIFPFSHANVVEAKTGLAHALTEAGRVKEADAVIAPLLRRIDELARRPSSLDAVLVRAARVKLHLNQAAEARRLFERSLVVVTKSYGKEHPFTVNRHVDLGEVCLHEKNYACAIKHGEYAVTMFAKLLKPNHPMMTGPLMLVGEGYRLDKQHARAIPYLERSLKVMIAAKMDASRIGRLRMSLAWSLVSVGGPANHKRAIELARQAHKEMVGFKGADKDLVKDAKQFLEKYDRKAIPRP